MQELNFQNIKPVPASNLLIDVAFRKARDAAGQKKSSMQKGQDRLNYAKDFTLLKIGVVKNYLVDEMTNQQQNFPSIDSLPEFYRELLNATIDYDSIKKSLGVFNWTKNTVMDIHKKYNLLIKRAQSYENVEQLKKGFFGRISSVLKQIKKDLDFLEGCRQIFRTYPTIKPNLQTFAIAGFPNVGKSTLLRKLTSAKPQIKNYAFTTKTLLIGYGEGMYDKVQFIDTPGTLNREDKMNNIELMAHYAMKYAAEKIIFVFDPTPTYDLKDQEKLLAQTKRYNKDILIYLSKTDLIKKEEIEKYRQKYPGILTDIGEIKKKLKIIN